MLTPTSNRWRFLRSGVFAAVATSVASMGHMVGGGGAPEPGVTLVAALAVGGVVSAATDQKRGLLTIFGLLAASQLAFHLLFTVAAHPMASAGSAEPTAVMNLSRMVVFHLTAAAVSAVVMAKGEAALFSIYAAVRQVIQRAAAMPSVDLPPAWTARPRVSDNSVPDLGVVHLAPRRGPPPARVMVPAAS